MPFGVDIANFLVQEEAPGEHAFHEFEVEPRRVHRRPSYRRRTLAVPLDLAGRKMRAMSLVTKLRSEVRETIRCPSRLKMLPARLGFRIMRRLAGSGGRWEEARREGVKRRRYASYRAYMRHQSSKLAD
jgi:hypothetical protein